MQSTPRGFAIGPPPSFAGHSTVVIRFISSIDAALRSLCCPAL